MSYIPAHQVFHAPAPASAAAAAPTPMPAPTPNPTLTQHLDALPDAAADTWPETQFTRARQVEFLHALADCGQVRRASAAIGISYRTAYRERRANRAFARAWDAALLSARALGEDVLACRALDGVEEVVWFRGEEVGRRIRFDSRLLLAHLARLDKLTEDARTRAYADDLAGALERYEAGTDDPAPVCDDCGTVLPMVADEPDSGSAYRTPLLDAGEPDGARAEGAKEGEPEAPVTFSPGQCDMCDMPSAKAAAARAAKRAEEERLARWETPCDRCGGRCNDPREELDPDECGYMADERFDAMWAARPVGVPTPEEIDPDNVEAVEDAQLAAFEAGEDEWWLVGAPETGGASGGVHGGIV